MATQIFIRRLTGTGKGKEEYLHTQEVSFGTGPHNTVRFDPVWDRGVAASHARIFRDESGVWWLEDNASPAGTLVNGQKVTQKRKLGGGFVVELGQGGPKVEVMLPPAEGQDEAATAGRGGRKTGAGGAGKWVGIAAVLAVLAGGAWFFFQSDGEGKPGPKSAQNDAAPALDSDERIRQAAKKYEGALGLVVLTDEDGGQPSGTAWAFADRMFATNAHIAAPLKKRLAEGGSAFIVCNKRPDLKLRVKAAYAHSGYFQEHRSIDGKNPVVGAYDVGVLVVDGDAPVKLPLASRDKLLALDAGTRVAFLGFPMENLRMDNVDMHYPVATMQSGIITSMTDFWLAQTTPERSLLIRHNLPSAGGASGSPIFDADGDVVGLHSAGNYTMGINFDTGLALRQQANPKVEAIEKIYSEKLAVPNLSEDDRQKILAEYNRLINLETGVSAANLTRVTSASLVNFAQRVDLLQELVGTIKE